MPDATLSLLPDDPPRFALVCSPRANDYAKQVPGLRFHKATESWRGPATLAAALAARALFGPGLRPTDEVYAYVQQINEEDALYASLLADPPQAPPLGRLFPFQAASAAGMRNYSWYLNCDDRGNGKSVQGVAAADVAGHTPALVVATKSMLHTWEEEFHAHAPHLRPHVITGTAPQRKKKIAAAREDGPLVVLICTRDVLKAHTRLAPYGSVSLTDKQKEPKEFNGGWLRTILVDEAHALKDPKAQQTRAAWAVGDEAERRIALTATPVVNTPSDLWGILRFLSPSEFPSRSKFRDRFVLTFENHWGGVEDIAFRPETRPEFDRILGPRYCRRPLQADVTLLPPQVRYLDMDPKQAKPYRQMEDGMIAELDGGILVASTVLTRLMRLQQLAAATPVVSPEGEVTALSAPSCKLDALVDLLHEADGDPLVVFAESRKLIELCYNTLTAEKGPGRSTPVPLSPENVGLITGQVSSVERAMHITKFQAGEYPLILCTIGAGSEGITLTRSRTCVFLQRSFSMVRNIQAEGRVVRHGQERPVQFIDLVTRDSVESRVHEALAYKEETMQDFTQDPGFVRRILRPDTDGGTA